MKLVTDENGNAVLENGHPVYEYEDGTKSPLDAKATIDSLNKKIGNLEERETRHNEKTKELKTKLKEFEGIDPEQAKKNAEKLQAIKDKDLLDKSGVEALKKEWSEQLVAIHKEEKDNLLSSFNKEKEEWEKQQSGLNNLIFDLAVKNKFANNEHFAGTKPKTIYTPEDASMIFGHHFQVEIGNEHPGGYKIIAKGPDGKPLLSKEKQGDYADFDEAIKILVGEKCKTHNIMRPGKFGGPGSAHNLDSNGGPSDSKDKIKAGLKKKFGSSGLI